MTERVLLVDDDARLMRMLSEYLGKNGFQAVVRGDGAAGLATAERESFDAVVLDVMLPDIDGFEICRKLRAKSSDVPILMLTARGDLTDRVVGLEIGADDYVPKPFEPRELLARLRALIRRRKGGSEPGRILRFGSFEVDLGAREARQRGERRALTGSQFNLLAALAESAGRVLSREQLLEKVGGDESEAFDRAIDVQISRLRGAIEDDPRHPRHVLTVRGIGYVLARSPQEAERAPQPGKRP